VPASAAVDAAPSSDAYGMARDESPGKKPEATGGAALGDAASAAAAAAAGQSAAPPPPLLLRAAREPRKPRTARAPAAAAACAQRNRPTLSMPADYKMRKGRAQRGKRKWARKREDRRPRRCGRNCTLRNHFLWLIMMSRTPAVRRVESCDPRLTNTTTRTTHSNARRGLVSCGARGAAPVRV